MGNSFFRFKQFTVHQEQCAMKVCTDACILGAYFADRVKDGSSVLDIGAGTGLLTLMLAQKIRGQFHAIEKDGDACNQLNENVRLSPWKEQIRVWQGDVLHFPLGMKFDFIICNPPFYENNLKSDSAPKNMARHDSALNLTSLPDIICRNLKEEGRFGVLLPYHRSAEFEKLALQKGFYLLEKLLIRQTPKHDFFRSILYYSCGKEKECITDELTIRLGDGNYSDSFASLLEAYYLQF